MSEDQLVDQHEQPVLDKEVVKDALRELLGEFPAFRNFVDGRRVEGNQNVRAGEGNGLREGVNQEGDQTVNEDSAGGK